MACNRFSETPYIYVYMYVCICAQAYSFRQIIKNINKLSEIKLMMINDINIFYASLAKINATHLVSVRVRAVFLYGYILVTIIIP